MNHQKSFLGHIVSTGMNSAAKYCVYFGFYMAAETVVSFFSSSFRCEKVLTFPHLPSS